MKSGFELLWSAQALKDLQNTIEYLSEAWTVREVQNFAKRLDARLNLILLNPELFPVTAERKSVRMSVLSNHTVVYYKKSGRVVTVVALFDARQNPTRLKI